MFCQLSLLRDLFHFVESICFRLLKVLLVLIAKMPCHHSQATESYNEFENGSKYISSLFHASESFSHHSCYKLSICDQIQFIYWNLVPSVMAFGNGAFGRWLGLEIGVFISEMSALVKHPRELPCLSALWKEWDDGHLWTRKLASTRHVLNWCLDRVLAAFKTMRNKHLLYKPPSPWYMVIAAKPNKTIA